MNLQDEVMKFVKIDSWITGRELAEQIALKYPEDFRKKPYLGDISIFTKALGSVLTSLRKQKRIIDDSTPYPGAKRWKRAEADDNITVEDAARALVKLNLANDENQAVRMLASRTVRENTPEFEALIKDANRVSEEALRIGKQMLGIKDKKS